MEQNENSRRDFLKSAASVVGSAFASALALAAASLRQTIKIRPAIRAQQPHDRLTHIPYAFRTNEEKSRCRARRAWTLINTCQLIIRN